MIDYADQQIKSRTTSDAFLGILGQPTQMPVSDWFRNGAIGSNQPLCHHHSFAILLDLPDLPGCEMVSGTLTADDQEPINHSWIELPLNNQRFVISANLVHIDHTIGIYTSETFYENNSVRVDRVASISHSDARKYLPDQNTINLLQLNKIVLGLVNKAFGLNLVSQTSREGRRAQEKCKVSLKKGH